MCLLLTAGSLAARDMEYTTNTQQNTHHTHQTHNKPDSSRHHGKEPHKRYTQMQHASNPLHSHHLPRFGGTAAGPGPAETKAGAHHFPKNGIQKED